MSEDNGYYIDGDLERESRLPYNTQRALQIQKHIDSPPEDYPGAMQVYNRYEGLLADPALQMAYITDKKQYERLLFTGFHDLDLRFGAEPESQSVMDLAQLFEAKVTYELKLSTSMGGFGRKQVGTTTLEHGHTIRNNADKRRVKLGPFEFG